MLRRRKRRTRTSFLLLFSTGNLHSAQQKAVGSTRGTLLQGAGKTDIYPLQGQYNFGVKGFQVQFPLQVRPNLAYNPFFFH